MAFDWNGMVLEQAWTRKKSFLIFELMDKDTHTFRVFLATNNHSGVRGKGEVCRGPGKLERRTSDRSLASVRPKSIPPLLGSTHCDSEPVTLGDRQMPFLQLYMFFSTLDN